MNIVLEEIHHYTDLRNKGLIRNAERIHSVAKIAIAVAGANHLIDEERKFNILSEMKRHKCALIIVKGEISEQEKAAHMRKLDKGCQ